MAITDLDVMQSVENVITELNAQIDKYNSDSDLTVEDEAVYLAEIKSAIRLLKGVHMPTTTYSKRRQYCTYRENQQLIYLAKLSIQENDGLTQQYNTLKNISYYVGE